MRLPVEEGACDFIAFIEMQREVADASLLSRGQGSSKPSTAKDW